MYIVFSCKISLPHFFSESNPKTTCITKTRRVVQILIPGPTPTNKPQGRDVGPRNIYIYFFNSHPGNSFTT